MSARGKLALRTAQTSDKRVDVEFRGLLSVDTGQRQCLEIHVQCREARRTKKHISAELDELDELD